MNILSYPLGYLWLQDEQGKAIYKRNLISVVLISIIITLIFSTGRGNYFGEKGFLDRFGSFSAVLTGFYIAALVGVANFSSNLGDLDKVISVGKIKRIVEGDECEYLTRRQYVCSMFGYLAFASLIISVAAIMLAVCADIVGISALKRQGFFQENPSVGVAYTFFRAFVILAMNALVAHMIVTTCYGLYYLIDRLYETEPENLPKPGSGE